MYSNKCVANVDAQRSQNLNPRWMCSGNGCGVSACIVSCHILNVAQREDEAVGGPGASPSWKVYKTVQDKFHVSCGPGRRAERETWCYHVCHTISSGLRQTKYQTYTSLKTAGSGLKSTADELDVSICSRVMASWGVNCWNWGLKNTRKKKIMKLPWSTSLQVPTVQKLYGLRYHQNASVFKQFWSWKPFSIYLIKSQYQNSDLHTRNLHKIPW